MDHGYLRPNTEKFNKTLRGKSRAARDSRHVILTYTETFDDGEEGDDEDDGEHWTKYYWRKNRKPPTYVAPYHTSSGGRARNRQKEESSGHPGDLTYKCRYLLSKADALYNKGDFEGALVLYHKGRKLRPNAEDFRLGVLKAEQALEKAFFPANNRKDKKVNETENEKNKNTKNVKNKENDKEKKEEKENEPEKPKDVDKETGKEGEKEKEKRESSKQGKDGNTEKDGEKKSTEKDVEKNENAETEAKPETKTEEEEEKAEVEKVEEDEELEEKPDLTKPEPPYYLDRKERVKEMRMAYAIRERHEARKQRLKQQMLTKPTSHLQDDKEFLEMLYKDFTNRKNKKARRVAKDAINYLDTRNRFWTQQTPHHLRERSTVMKKTGLDPSKTGPPPTQAMYKFVIKEMMRINNMLEKNQFHRTIDNAKKLIDHINQMDKNIPNKYNILANLFSIIGQAYMEMGDYKKSLAFHMKDLQLSTELDLDEAKSRALDNTGRVFARTGEFAKAIAVWEQKLASHFYIAPGEKAWLCHELGYCYIEIEDFEKARESGEKSLEAAKEAADKQWQLNASILIAQALLHAGDAYKSKEAFEKALKLAIEADDQKAKDSIEPALKELDKVIEEWKKMETEEGTPRDQSPRKPSKTPTTERESSSKSERSKASWLLGDDVTDNAPNDVATSSVNNEQKENASKKSSIISPSRDSFYTKRKTTAAIYIGGRDSDFAITTSAESADEEKERSSAKNSVNTRESSTKNTRNVKENKKTKNSGNKDENQAKNSKKESSNTNKKPFDSNSKPPKQEQPKKVAENSRKSKYDYTKPRREVSFSRSPGQSPTRSPQREIAFLKPRREASFSRNPKRDNSNNTGAETRLWSPEEKHARTTAIYSFSRELSNVSARGPMKREKSNLSLKSSKQKYKSTNDLSAKSDKRRKPTFLTSDEGEH